MKKYLPHALVALALLFVASGNFAPVVIPDRTLINLFGAAITLRDVLIFALLIVLLRYIPSPLSVLVMIGIILYLLSMFGFLAFLGSGGIFTILLVLLLLMFLAGLM